MDGDPVSAGTREETGVLTYADEPREEQESAAVRRGEEQPLFFFLFFYFFWLPFFFLSFYCINDFEFSMTPHC